MWICERAPARRPSPVWPARRKGLGGKQPAVLVDQLVHRARQLVAEAHQLSEVNRAALLHRGRAAGVGRRWPSLRRGWRMHTGRHRRWEDPCRSGRLAQPGLRGGRCSRWRRGRRGPRRCRGRRLRCWRRGWRRRWRQRPCGRVWWRRRCGDLAVGRLANVHCPVTLDGGARLRRHFLATEYSGSSETVAFGCGVLADTRL